MNISITTNNISESITTQYLEFLIATLILGFFYFLILFILPEKYRERIYFYMSYIWVILLTILFIWSFKI